MALVFARVVKVVPAQPETAKHPLHPDGFLALVNLPGFGLVSRINALGRLLEQPADQAIGRFENGSAHQYFQLGHDASLWGLGLKPGDQLLDFLFLGKEDRWRDWFFFESVMPWRVWAITKLAYSSVSRRN